MEEMTNITYAILSFALMVISSVNTATALDITLKKIQGFKEERNAWKYLAISFFAIIPMAFVLTKAFA